MSGLYITARPPVGLYNSFGVCTLLVGYVSYGYACVSRKGAFVIGVWELALMINCEWSVVNGWAVCVEESVER